MKLKDESLAVSRPVTLRVLKVMDYVLSKPSYGIPSIRQFAHSIGLESQHIYEFKNDENRNVKIFNAIRVCNLYGISANWLLLGIGEMKLKKDKEELSLEERLSVLENELKSIKKKSK